MRRLAVFPQMTVAENLLAAEPHRSDRNPPRGDAVAVSLPPSACILLSAFA